MFPNDILFTAESVKPLLYVGLTILIAALIDNVLRSLIKVPKPFANRRASNAAVIIKNIISFFIYAIALYTILTILGVNLAPLLASASILGIIIGIGARSIIEDFVTGLFFLSLDSVAIGDYVKIGDVEGYVDKIGSRTINIKAGDGAMHVFPNSQVKGIANFSRHRSITLIDLPLKSNQSIDAMIEAASKALDDIKKDKTFEGKIYPESKVNGISGFSQPEITNLQVCLVTKSASRWEVARAYRLQVKKELEKKKLMFA